MKILKRFEDYPGYPALLTLAENPIWISGDLEILKMPLVSIVGSRDVSANGVLVTQKCAKILVDHNIGIVSGLALGVDSVAHNYALDHGGKTVAVIGTPIDQCYPKENMVLQNAIEHYGLVLSQFPPGSEVHKWNFPKRNVTMAVISGITIVTEATESSGTRHQVSHAEAIGRRVGFPNSLVQRNIKWIDGAIESGCGFVIREPQDLINQLEKVFSL